MAEVLSQRASVYAMSSCYSHINEPDFGSVYVDVFGAAGHMQLYIQMQFFVCLLCLNSFILFVENLMPEAQSLIKCLYIASYL